MIGISKLYCGTVEPSDVLRYGAKAKKLPSHLLQFSRRQEAGRRLELHAAVQPPLPALLFAARRTGITKRR